MLTPQFTDAASGYGLGFRLGTFHEFPSFHHMGAVYGFTSILTGLPREKLGVVVLSNDDLAIAAVKRVHDAAMGLMLESKLGWTPPPAPPDAAPDPARWSAWTGSFESESFWAELTLTNGGLVAVVSGQPMTLRAVGDGEFLGTGRLVDEAPFGFRTDASGETDFTALGQTFKRVPSDRTEVPPHWRRWVGSYGPACLPLHVAIRHGRLYAMVENEYEYRLRPLTQTTFAMTPGMYGGEYLEFQTTRWGRVRGAVLANIRLKR
jgi:hypothetical protein